MMSDCNCILLCLGAVTVATHYAPKGIFSQVDSTWLEKPSPIFHPPRDSDLLKARSTRLEWALGRPWLIIDSEASNQATGTWGKLPWLMWLYCLRLWRALVCTDLLIGPFQPVLSSFVTLSACLWPISVEFAWGTCCCLLVTQEVDEVCWAEGNAIGGISSWDVMGTGCFLASFPGSGCHKQGSCVCSD